jgi:tetratricopeptide (TPR) repeat protein
LKQALAIAQRNDHALYRTMTLIVIAEHLSQAGQKKQVPQLLEHALKSASAIDEAQSGENASMKISQMLRIVKQFAFIGQERRAIELLDQSLPKIRTLADKRFPLDKISQLIETAAQYAALEQKNKALSTLAEAQKAAQAIAIDEAQIKSDALARVAHAYAELGNFDQARQIARAIENVNARKRAFLGIAIAYGKAGYSDQAVKLATSIGNRDATFRGIVRHYLNSRQYDQAFEIIQQWNFKDMLSEVAFGYLETGQPERALQITLSIQPPPDATHKDWRFSAIARGFAKQGKFDQALQVAQAITDKSYKAQALTAIAEQYVAREREKKGPIEKIFFVLTNSYNSLFGSSNKDKASKILDQALQVAQSMAPKRATQ